MQSNARELNLAINSISASQSFIDVFREFTCLFRMTCVEDTMSPNAITALPLETYKPRHLAATFCSPLTLTSLRYHLARPKMAAEPPKRSWQVTMYSYMERPRLTDNRNEMAQSFPGPGPFVAPLPSAKRLRLVHYTPYSSCIHR